jgi:spore coat protein H
MNAKFPERARPGSFFPVLTWVMVSSWCLTFCGVRISAAETTAPPIKPDELFQTAKVWTLHLQFTPEQWKAMEPEESEAMPGPGGPGFGPGARGGFGPAMFLAPTFLKADFNHDGKLSREEFGTLGEGWFRDWDKTKQGQLDLHQIQQGMSTSLAPEQGGGDRTGGPPGPPLQGAEGHRNGLASAAGIDFKYVHADLEFEGNPIHDVAVRYKGNGTFMESRGSIKRSLKIDLNKYVKGQKIAGQTKLNLHNNVTDASWMNEVLSYRLFRDAGVPAPRTAYAKLYVSVPGQYDRKYFGLYSIVEEVDSHFAHDRFGSKQGAIFKPTTSDLFEYLGQDWTKYKQSYDPKTDPEDPEKQRVVEFSKLVTEASDAEFSARLAEYLDLQEFARFMSVTVWVSTMDSILMMGQNFYVYLHPQTHQFSFVPWDLDHSFGQFPMAGTQEQREQLSVLKPWRGANRFLERVFKVESFKKLYLATMKEFSKTIFLPERLSQQVDQLAPAIRPAVAEESDVKLARFDTVVAGGSVEHLGFGGGPARGPGGPGRDGRPRFGPGGFGQTVKPVKGFVTARAQSVNEQLAGKSEGAPESELGFGGRGPGRMGGGPGGFGPGMFLGSGLLEAFDTNKDGKLSHEEFTAGFAKWFSDWNSDKSGQLSEEQLRAGINRDLVPFRGGGPGFGPDGPPDE